MKIRTKLTAVISAAAMLSMTAGAVPAFAASADTQAFIDSSNRSLLSAAFDPTSYAEDLNTLYKKNLYQTAVSYNWDDFDSSDITPVNLADSAAALQKYYADPDSLSSTYIDDEGNIVFSDEYPPYFGFNWTFAYDAAGNTIATNNVEIANPDGTYEYGTAPIHRTRALTYDDAGRLTSVNATGSQAIDYTTVTEDYSWFNNTSYTLNAAGQATAATITVPDDSYQVSISYDKYGRISKMVYNDAEGTQSTYRYTYKNNRIVKASYKDSDGNTSAITYTYDSAKRPVGAVRDDTTYFFTYDDAGRLFETTQVSPYDGPNEDWIDEGVLTKYYVQYNY
ncbi:MAG: hypothetical protein ACI4OJ_12810 [Lachnospiraceae bacterium]